MGLVFTFSNLSHVITLPNSKTSFNERWLPVECLDAECMDDFFFWLFMLQENMYVIMYTNKVVLNYAWALRLYTFPSIKMEHTSR